MEICESSLSRLSLMCSTCDMLNVLCETRSCILTVKISYDGVASNYDKIGTKEVPHY